jgi:hypothetical protein
VSDIDPKELSDLLALPYSVETQTKIARLLNVGGDAESQFACEEHFEGAMMLLSLISSKIVGKRTTLGRSFGSAVLGKICLTAVSAQALFRAHEAGELPTLDHSSIAVLSRTIIESSIMYWYLTEEVSEEEWAFRLQVMKIHDSSARVRFWKSLMPEQADEERAILSQLRDELKEMPAFRKRAEPDKTKMRGGQTVYVNGMRSVVKSMGIDETYFDGVYNYLSAQVHATPISYFRDSNDPATSIVWSRAFSAYSLHHARLMMIRVAYREIQLSGLEGEFDAGVINECREIAARKILAPSGSKPTI